MAIPFDYLQYCNMSEEGKDVYWINTVENIFTFLEAKMRCEDDKLKRYISFLHESDIKIYKQKVIEAYNRLRV